jgi:hypothetical protein
MSSPLWKYSAAVAGLLVAMSVTAEAQVCGDADGNDKVTVTDGVQVLRKAADLSSSCGATLCDVDGNGKVTVTDGVQVLRKAADLPITGTCSGVTGQLEALLGPTLPTLSIFGPLTKLGSSAQAKMAASAQAAGQNICENPTGEFSVDQATGEITFFDCEFGGFAFDGTIGVDGSTIAFDLDFTNLKSEESISFLGDLTAIPSGENSVLNGNLEIDFSDLTLSSVALTFEDVVSDPAGNSISGHVLFDASDSDIAGVVGIRVDVAPSTIVPVAVIFDDKSTRNFTFDTGSGKLTPVSN